MDIYLTADGERLRIPLLPDRLSVKMGTVSVGFTIIKNGEYKIPRGTSLTGYSWNGVFPGIAMNEASFVHDWQAPTRIIATLTRWMEENKIIHLMVTETTINDDVFIENFVFDHFGVDNVSYTLTLTKYRPLIVTTAPPQPEVIIPEQSEEEPEEKHEDTKTQSTSSNKSNDSTTRQANKSNTSNTTTKLKLSISIPTKKLAAAAMNAATKIASVVVDLKKGKTALSLNQNTQQPSIVVKPSSNKYVNYVK